MGTPWKDHPSFELASRRPTSPAATSARSSARADHDTLKQTDNAQLATFVLSLIVLDGAERVGLEPGLCAGHSLGEYTALVAAGALDYEDALRLVAERGAAMQHAAEVNPGTMAAVLGMDDDAVESACTLAEGDVWVANYNAPGQVVIAGIDGSRRRGGAHREGDGREEGPAHPGRRRLPHTAHEPGPRPPPQSARLGHVPRP